MSVVPYVLAYGEQGGNSAVVQNCPSDPCNYGTGFKWLPWMELLIHLFIVMFNGLVIVALVRNKSMLKIVFPQLVALLCFVLIVRSILSILTRSMVSILFTHNITGYAFWPSSYLNIGSVSNFFLSYLLALLVVVISINRCTVIMSKKLDDFLFERFRYQLILVVSLIISALTSWQTVFKCNIQRLITHIGVLDTAYDLTFYLVSQFFVCNQTEFQLMNRIYFGVSMLSVAFYFCICLFLLRNNKQAKQSNTYSRVQRNVSIQIGASLLFSLMFPIITELSNATIDGSFTIYLIEYVNAFCYLPDMFIPLFLLFQSKDLRRSLIKQSVKIPVKTPKTLTTNVSF